MLLIWGKIDDVTPLVQGEDLAKRFSGSKLVVLDGVNLEMAAGESLVIIGGSGSGKSVCIKTILGLITPDQGTIEVDGQDVTER